MCRLQFNFTDLPSWFCCLFMALAANYLVFPTLEATGTIRRKKICTNCTQPSRDAPATSALVAQVMNRCFVPCAQPGTVRTRTVTSTGTPYSMHVEVIGVYGIWVPIDIIYMCTARTVPYRYRTYPIIIKGRIGFYMLLSRFRQRIYPLDDIVRR